jgi:hypothetical protein
MFYKGPEAGRITASVMAKGVENHDLAGLEEETTKMTDVPGLPSSAGNRLQGLRHELVLQLYLRRDPLWEAIRDVRDRWNISAEVRLPRRVRGRLSPEKTPNHQDQGYAKYVVRWQEEMSAIWAKVDPEPRPPTWDYSDYQLQASWEDFLSACVLYDPPEDQLVEFASYGALETTVLTGGRLATKANLEGLPEMIDPPVRSLWALSEVRDWYWHRVLRYIGELDLELQGVDVDALIENATLYVPGLEEEYREKVERYSKRYYIGVDDYTSLEDVKSAFHMIRKVQPHKGTKRSRDPLVAVQCALLYDRHNRRDPEDRRRWRWSYANLADRFGLSSARVASDYVALGREILSGRGREEI